ncbi:hypothetical protein BY996DRAFT_6576608 [Phakopsora pachyrhizi]|nr:hypothetical protein BY996DRAFT_6576608 [Phakopsora pachyrhizi]
MSVLIYNHNKMTRIYDPLDNQGKCSWLESSLMRKRGARWPEGAVKCFIAPRPQKEGAIDASHDRHDKKYQKRIGTSWDRRRQNRKRLIITGPTKQGNKRADKIKYRCIREPKKNEDWLTDKEAMGRKRQGGRPREGIKGEMEKEAVVRILWGQRDATLVITSVLLEGAERVSIRGRRRTDIRYISKAVWDQS